ncbi:MAG: MCP four helix bundle domain-containing protein [Deltaproteobacteria bacterium]|nr:MCP four helix bundle domain-containing protein [Deltaproteobacteria bacterium]
MKNLAMSSKIYGLLGILVLVAGIVAGLGVKEMASINDQLNNIVDNNATSVRLAAGINTNLVTISRAEKNLILSDDPTKMNQFIAVMQEQAKIMAERLEKLRGLSTETEKVQLNQFGELWGEYQKANQEVMRLSLLNSNVRAKELSAGQGRAAFDKAEAALDQLVNFQEAADKALAQAGQDQIARTLLATNLLNDMLALHRAEKNAVLATDEESMKQFAQNVALHGGRVDQLLSKLEQVLSAGDRSKLAQFKEAWQEFNGINQKVMAATLENGNQLAFLLSSGKGRELSDQAQAIIRGVMKGNEEEMVQAKERSDEVYASSRLFMILVALIGILGALGLAVLILTGINRRMDVITSTLTEGANQTAVASGEVSQSSQQLASGASQQAASLEETSSSLEEITSMTRQNADNANQAKALTDEAAAVVDKAGRFMTELSRSMAEISEQGRDIGKIIKTIDEIAFQTNLLALNAAVEAARAGEAGAGFAVVADEVRNLAMRAASAAKNTAELIEATIQKIGHGSGLVSETSTAFSEVATGSAKVAGLIAEIAAASNEQSQGIGQINTAMSEVDKVTQAIAANAEESASASEELSAQAETMRGIVEELLQLVKGSRTGNGHDPAHHALSGGYGRSGSKGQKRQSQPRLPAPAAGRRPARSLPTNQAAQDAERDFENF